MLFLVYQLVLKIQLKIYSTSPIHPSHSPTSPPISDSDNTPLSQKRNTEQWLPIFGGFWRIIFPKRKSVYSPLSGFLRVFVQLPNWPLKTSNRCAYRSPQKPR